MEESKEKNLETEDCDLAYDCHISVSNKKEKVEGREKIFENYTIDEEGIIRIKQKDLPVLEQIKL